MEFGVLNGQGAVDIIRQLRGTHYKAHYGFDSFEGFGKISEFDEQKSVLQPMFSSGVFVGLDKDAVYKSIKSHVMFDSELHLIEGFFEKSLKSFDKSQLSGFPLLLYVDCDLYTSSKEVFEFIDDVAQTGTWILCDDYWCYRGHPLAGQRRAMDEWLENSKRVGVTPYSNFNGFGRAFIAYTKD